MVSVARGWLEGKRRNIMHHMYTRDSESRRRRHRRRHRSEGAAYTRGRRGARAEPRDAGRTRRESGRWAERPRSWPTNGARSARQGKLGERTPAPSTAAKPASEAARHRRSRLRPQQSRSNRTAVRSPSAARHTAQAI